MTGSDADFENEMQHLLEEVTLGESWTAEVDGKTLTLDYEAVPLDRLERKSRPGVDVSYIGGMWMFASHDRIGDGLELDNENITNHGAGVDCPDFDDAVTVLEHGMEKVELGVGEELADVHEPGVFPYA